MTGFIIKSPKLEFPIRFMYYGSEAPVTVNGFSRQLPFERVFYHARLSGQEIWTNDGLKLDIIQENASVFAEPGEVVLGPVLPSRARTADCIGIYYGQGRGLDSCNIFARVVDEDRKLLERLGEIIWRQGEQVILFTAAPA